MSLFKDNSIAMKKFLLFSAFLALCGHLTAADNLLQGIADEKVTQLEQYVTVDVSDLNVKSGFVLSFTLNQEGITYLNNWGNKLYEEWENGEKKFLSTPVIVSMGLNLEDDYLYGVGWSGKPHEKIAGKPTGSVGTFAITTAWDEVTYSEHLGSGGKWCKTSDERKVIDRSNPDKEIAQQDIKAVALTLTGDVSGLLELTASVKYANDELLVFTAKSDDDEDDYYYLGSLEGGNLLVVNTGFVDVKEISLSYEFEEGETAESRNLKLLSSGAPSVPEPATATLSLLALAGLAARRKRH